MAYVRGKKWIRPQTPSVGYHCVERSMCAEHPLHLPKVNGEESHSESAVDSRKGVGK